MISALFSVTGQGYDSFEYWASGCIMGVLNTKVNELEWIGNLWLVF